MSAGLGALRDDDVDSALERPRFLGGRRRPEHDDAALAKRSRIDDPNVKEKTGGRSSSTTSRRPAPSTAARRG